MNINQNPKLKQSVQEIFNKADPIGLIAIGAPPDEYEKEICAVMNRVGQIHDIASCNAVLFEEFQRWFGDMIAGTDDVYNKLAEDLFSFLRNEGLV